MNKYAPALSQRLSLDLGWRFHRGDIPMPEITGYLPSYENAKAGKAWGAAAPGFDDSDWRILDVPHDWVVEGPFLQEANVSQGYRPTGIAWYRKAFRLDEDDNGKFLELQFDGIATHATVWVNGLLVHRNFCGYTPFQIDITPLATYGEQLNSVAIRVDAEAREGWWYEGGGLYRHTWLVKRSPVFISTYGLFASPISNGGGCWSVPVEVTLGNIERLAAAVSVTAELRDPDGHLVVVGRSQASVPSLGTVLVPLALEVTDPQLWSPDSPSLYTVDVMVWRDDAPIDSAQVPCGFRSIRFDPALGFFLNDRPLKLQGTCNHQDHAGVGVAVPDALWEFRIRRLQEMGCNAYRAAHNPPAPEFLDACDRLGMLVMNENRNFNHTPEYLGQLAHLVRRDRNHPSVILWSVFNEEPMQETEQGREMVRRMVAEVRKWDPSRPVTAAVNGGFLNDTGVFEVIDVMGFNYTDYAYDAFHQKHPTIPITSAEDTSAFMTRGEFENDPSRNVVSSYDTEVANWGQTHRKAWQLIAERPFVAGGFVWTGFDYRGEPQRLEWPSVSSVFGIMDTCGFPKTAFYIHQSHWIKDRPVLAIAPHWNWPGKEGQPVRVIVMTNAEVVELFLNGQSLGEKGVPVFDYADWIVPYEPGKLLAVARKNGEEVARATMETTGEAVALHWEWDGRPLRGDGCDAAALTIQAVDAAGRIVPRSNPLVTFTLQGAGKILGHGNGDHNCHDPEQGNQRRLFHGLAQVIVQSEAGGCGALVVEASCPGLDLGVLTLDVKNVRPRPTVPAIQPVFFLKEWRMSPPQNHRPNPTQEMAEADMNTWPSVNTGTLQNVPPGAWAIYRTRFLPWKNLQREGGRVMIKKVVGLEEAWLDGGQVPVPSAAGEFEFVLPPSSNLRVLTLILRSGPSGDMGLQGVAQIVRHVEEGTNRG